MTPPVSLLTLFWVFTKLGMTSFGGGLSGWIHREVVLKHRWMTEDQFIAGVALTQVMPGPNAVNLALFIGQRLRGGPGLTVSGLGVLLPPFAFILVLAVLYAQVAGSVGVRFVLSGMAAAGVGMTVIVAIRSARRIRTVAPALVAIALFVGVGLLQLPMIGLLVLFAPLSVWLAWRELAGTETRAGKRAGTGDAEGG